MQQMFHQSEPEPPSKSHTMEKIGLPSILVIITLLGSIVGTIYLGTTHIIGFNWLLITLGCLMLAITVFFAWYSIRTKQKLQEQYNKDRDASQTEYLQFRQKWESYFNNEVSRWNTWAVDFSKQSDKEHKERTEELKRQCMEAIAGAEQRFDIGVKNAQTLFTGTMETNKFIINHYQELLVKTMKQVDVLEKRLDEMTKTDNKE